MNLLSSQMIHCPYCGETIEIVIDCSVAEQEYIEDCEVCCRPITLCIEIENGEILRLATKNENDTYSY